MAKKISQKNSQATNNHKNQIETLFAPWIIKKWSQSQYGNSFIAEIKDTVTLDSKTGHKEANVHSFFIENNSSEVNVTVNQLSDWANESKPTILIFNKKDGKIGYLLLEDHFLNTLISENPSRSALDHIAIDIKQFAPLTRSEIKHIREFIFKWKKMFFSVLESGTYFNYKDALKTEVNKAITELERLKVGTNLDVLKEIDEEINKAIYTVAVVGATKAGKSTIINSLVSKYVSPIDIRPTTGIPTNIVPGKEEKAEVLFQDETVITGVAEESFLNQYVAIDENRSNHKKVKMVTVWVKSAQMEKGLSFCDFPGLDDADPVIEKTVINALKFVNAIIYVIDASGMTSGFKFPKHYRDDLLNLKNKDRIFLVINKIDHFNDSKLLEQFKDFIDEELERLELKSLFPYPPIYMTARKSFEQRQMGIYEKDEMSVLESQVWDHLLANSKSGLHNLMNIIGQVNLESERLCRTLNLRIIHGNKRNKIKEELEITRQELDNIKIFERRKRKQISSWLVNTLNEDKLYLIQHYKNYLQEISLNNELPNDNSIGAYLVDQFTEIAPDIFEQLENHIAQLHNELNGWVNNKLQAVEISIDKHSKHQFQNSETFSQLMKPVAHIFSESYGKSVPKNMLGNIAYHVLNAVQWLGDIIGDIFTDARTIRKTKINTIIRKLTRCYDETFEKLYQVFNAHLEHKCGQLLSKVVDRTDVYIAGMNKQMSELNHPLTLSEKKLHELATERLIDLDNQCSAIKLQIEEQTAMFKYKSETKPEGEIENADQEIEIIEKELRSLLNTVLVKKMATDEAKKIILPHLQPKIEERISKIVRDHPGTDTSKYKTFESQLQFFDMSEYFETMTNKMYWEFFKENFNNKENLQKHIYQLSNLRNAIRHSREKTKLIVAEGEASILWFKMALKIKIV